MVHRQRFFVGTFYRALGLGAMEIDGHDFLIMKEQTVHIGPKLVETRLNYVSWMSSSNTWAWLVRKAFCTAKPAIVFSGPDTIEV